MWRPLCGASLLVASRSRDPVENLIQGRSATRCGMTLLAVSPALVPDQELLPMYDMYPWHSAGPGDDPPGTPRACGDAASPPDAPLGAIKAVQVALDRRDNGGDARGGASGAPGPPVRFWHGLTKHRAGRHRRGRDRPRGGRRGAQGAAGRGARGHDQRDQLRPRGAPLAPDRGDAARRGARGDQGPRRHPAGRGRRPERAERGARARPAAAAALRARPLRQPAPGAALPGRRLRRWPARGRKPSTWW